MGMARHIVVVLALSCLSVCHGFHFNTPCGSRFACRRKPIATLSFPGRRRLSQQHQSITCVSTTTYFSQQNRFHFLSSSLLSSRVDSSSSTEDIKVKRNNATESIVSIEEIEDAASISAAKPSDSGSESKIIDDKQHEVDVSPLKSIWDSLGLGIEPTPEIIAIMTIYFVEGALGLARLAQTYLLKDTLHLGPAEMSALTGALVLPWTIKPLYGFLSDGFPFWGYRRKSYLVLTGVTGGLSYALLSWSPFWDSLDQGVAIAGTVGALLLSSACVAFSDVVADGIVVSQTRQSKDSAVAGGLQSLCWGSAALGGLLSAYFSGSLLEVIPVRSVFGITAVLPFLVALIALQMNEEPVSKTSGSHTKTPEQGKDDDLVQGVKQQIESLWSALKEPSIWKPALFLFLWQSTPTSDGAFFYFLSNDIGLGPEFMGRVRLVTALASLGGVILYNQYLKALAIRDILFWSTIASFPLGMLPVLLITHANRELGISDQYLIYGDDVALAALGEIAFLPTLVLAARLCPPGIEAVLFATLMSIFNGAGTLGTEIGALLTKALGVTESNFENLALLTVLCNVTSLYPLLFIGLLDQIGNASEKDLEAQASDDNDAAITLLDDV